MAAGARPDAVIAATGSELHLALAARQALGAEGKKINVVSIPCLDRFLAQPSDYVERLFPAGVPRVSIEAGSTGPWREIVGPEGLSIGVDRFGASAPAEVNAERFGLTPESVTQRIRDWLSR